MSSMSPRFPRPVRSRVGIAAATLLAVPMIAVAQPAGPGAGGAMEDAEGDAPGGPPAGVSAEPLSFQLTLAGSHRFETELDEGAEYDVTSFVVEPELTWNASATTAWTFSVSYALDQYDFSGSGGLGGLDPWDDVSHLSVSALVRHRLNDDWTFFGGPSIRFGAESGANLDDGLSAGGFLGAGYRVSDRLTIGPGIGLFSEIEGSVDVFPVLIVNWRIRDDLTLRTGGGTGASRGPGLELAWQLDDSLEFALGSRYDSDRFRLDDEGVAPDGVGEEEGFSLVAGLRWRPTDNVDLAAFGGVRFAGKLVLEDEDGNELFDEDVDPQPVLGVNLSLRF